MTTADSIEDALKIPESAAEGPARDLYERARERITGGSPREIIDPFARAPRYRFTYHSQRFVMGTETDFDESGNKVKIERDDNVDLNRVYQLQADGEAIIMKRLDQILADGTVVIWLEWTTPLPKEKEEPRPAHARTVGELLNPRIPPASEGAIPPESREPPPTSQGQGVDPLTPPTDDLPAGEMGDSYEDDEDWS